MTIRTIPATVPGIALGTGLQKMFGLREQLQPLYRTQESLPAYPLDFQARSSQVLIKDFLYRTIEEVGEVYRAEIAIYQALTNNDTENTEEVVVTYNEEIADVTQFLFQLFLYSNITADSILSYYEVQLKENGLESLLLPRDLLTSCFNVADHILMEEEMAYFQQHSAYIAEFDPGTKCCKGGNKSSADLLDKHRIYLFDFINQLAAAGNMLKSRPWRQTDTYTEGKNFQAALIEAWACWLKYCSFVGLKAPDLFELYWLKGQVNLHRINSGY